MLLCHAKHFASLSNPFPNQRTDLHPMCPREYATPCRLEVERVGREDLVGPDLRGDDLLAVGVLDERPDSWAVRFEAKGQRVATADHLLGLQNVTVIRRGRPRRGEVLPIEFLRHLEGAQELRRDPGVLCEHCILDHDEAVDGENLRPLVPRHL